jgi:hypothetical protein
VSYAILGGGGCFGEKELGGRRDFCGAKLGERRSRFCGMEVLEVGRAGRIGT